MRRVLCCLAALSLLVSAAAFAEVAKAFRAYVIAVDANAKTIKFRVSDDATPPQWSEVAATWDDATTWEQAPEVIYKRVPAKADLAAKLKKDTKVYVDVTDRGSSGQHWWLEKLTTIPTDSTVP
jgi:hypothetical protein